MSDNVNHPKHYQKEGRPECIQEMLEKFGTIAVYWFSKLSAYKYRYRAGYKDGNSAEQDEAKAVWYDNETEKMRALGAPSGWVKCSDRLPEKHGFYIVYMESYDRYDVMCFTENKRFWNPRVMQSVIDSITHWMQLPDAPEEANE